MIFHVPRGKGFFFKRKKIRYPRDFPPLASKKKKEKRSLEFLERRVVSQDQSFRYLQVSYNGDGRQEDGGKLEVERTETSDHDYKHGTTNTDLVTSARRHWNDRDR